MFLFHLQLKVMQERKLKSPGNLSVAAEVNTWDSKISILKITKKAT